MRYISEEEAIKLLRKHAPNEKSFKKVLEHGRAVQKAALEIAKGTSLDLEFVKGAALLHDIGRFKCKPEEIIRHGLYGARILTQEGFPEYALMAERHIGAGISKDDITEQRLDLPSKDFLPVSREEKLIAHADNLISGTNRIPVETAVERFKKGIGEKASKRVEKLAKEVESFK